MTPASMAIVRLVESTVWHVGGPDPVPIYVTLSCRHVLATDSRHVEAVLRQHDARPVLHDHQLRVEMRCQRCEAVGTRVPA